MVNIFRKIILLFFSAIIIGISFAIAYNNQDFYQLKISEYFYTMTLIDLFKFIAVLILFLTGIGNFLLFYIHFTKKAFK